MPFKLSRLIFISLSTTLIYSLSFASKNQILNQDEQYILKAADLINKVQLSGRIMPTDIIDITAATNAKIAKIYVHPGQRVQKDQIILELESDQLDIDIRNAQEMYIKTQMDYDKKQSWQDSDEVFQATQTHLKNKLNFQRLHEIYKQNLLLFKQGIISHNELEQSEISYKDSQLNLKLSERHVKQIVNQGNATQLNLLKLSLENAKAKLEILEKIKQKLTIKSPLDGIILRASKQDNENKTSKFLAVGQNVTTGESLMNIGDTKGFGVTVLANEQIIQNVQINQKVKIHLPALNHAHEFSGTIVAIDAQPKDSEASNGSPKYSLKIIADETLSNDKVFLGMTSKISFDLIEKSNTILIPLSSVAYNNMNQPYVLKYDNNSNTPVQTPIQLGKTTSDKIEVLAGLSPEDIIHRAITA